MSAAPLHVIFGAGQVGSGLAAALRRQGARVRVVRRGPAEVPGVEVVRGDAADPAFAIQASAGAAVIYHCMNPSTYSAKAWTAELPRLMSALSGAALAHGARLVYLDNLYAYGEVAGARTTSTPFGAAGPKGQLRAALARQMAATPGLRWTSGRAGDFFGPGAAGQSLISPDAVRRLARGGALWGVGDADAPHAFSYVPDVVAGLAALGLADDDVEGQVFHLPVVQVSLRALGAALGAAAGQRTSVHTLPVWTLRLLGPLVPLLGELRETAYQWDRPFLVDDGPFRARFPGLGTALADAAAETVAQATAGERRLLAEARPTA